MTRRIFRSEISRVKGFEIRASALRRHHDEKKLFQDLAGIGGAMDSGKARPLPLYFHDIAEQQRIVPDPATPGRTPPSNRLRQGLRKDLLLL